MVVLEEGIWPTEKIFVIERIHKETNVICQNISYLIFFHSFPSPPVTIFIRAEIQTISLPHTHLLLFA